MSVTCGVRVRRCVRRVFRVLVSGVSGGLGGGVTGAFGAMVRKGVAGVEAGREVVVDKGVAGSGSASMTVVVVVLGGCARSGVVGNARSFRGGCSGGITSGGCGEFA